MARDQNLYSRDGAYPAKLPDEAADATGRMWTQPMEADAIAACGFVEVDDPPTYDPETEALGWDGSAWTVTALPPPEPAPLPAEVPMYKVRKYLALRKFNTGDDLMAAIVDYIEALPEPNRALALEDLNYSPNLVTASPLALGAKTAMGLTDEQYADMIFAAAAMP